MIVKLTVDIYVVNAKSPQYAQKIVVAALSVHRDIVAVTPQKTEIQEAIKQ